MKIININKIKEDKIQKNKDVQNTLDDVAYYFSLGWVDVNFGGAYVRNLIEQLNKNKETILKVFKKNSDLNRAKLNSVKSKKFKEDPAYLLVEDAVNKQEALFDEIINSLKTPHDLNAMFDDDSKYLPFIGFVLMVIMVHSYSEFDYYLMLRNRWMNLSLTVENFMNSPEYKRIKKMA